ncbi:MAG: tRNA (adenosine(37)-N6)-dimethylallyltransferase MiaA [Actinomycetes bacterium]
MEKGGMLAVFGPTAVGKTALVVALAEQLRAIGHEPVAISADALAVYREIPILTGAPTSVQRDVLDHRLVGIRSVVEEFSAGEFADLAHAEIDSAIASGRSPIVVGGTGLYLRAAVSRLNLRPPVAEAIRAKWQRALVQQGAPALHSRLTELDPVTAARIEQEDGRRVTRALELIESGQQPPLPSNGLWQASPRVPTVAVGLLREPAEHRDRVARRARAIFDGGGREEVLRAESLGPSATARAAIGWSELLAGDLDALTSRTWQLVRRQRTWMRKMRDVAQLDVTGLDDAAAAELLLGHLERTTAVQPRS